MHRSEEEDKKEKTKEKEKEKKKKHHKKPKSPKVSPTLTASGSSELPGGIVSDEETTTTKPDDQVEITITEKDYASPNEDADDEQPKKEGASYFGSAVLSILPASIGSRMSSNRSSKGK